MIRLVQENFFLIQLSTKSHNSKSIFEQKEHLKDANLQGEEKMKEINKKLEKLIIGSCTNSIGNDLSNGNMIFNEESSRAIYGDGQHGVDRTETNLGDYSVSFLPEERT